MNNENDAGDISSAAEHTDVGDSSDSGIPAKQSLWTRSFVVIWLVNFLNSVIFILLMIVMSKVATDRFGVSPAVAGLSASIFVIGSFVTRPFLGKRSTTSARPGSVHRVDLSLAFTLAYFAVDSAGSLLLVRFLHGAAHGTTALAVRERSSPA